MPTPPLPIRLHRLAGAVLGALAFSFTASAATYFVSPAGDDTRAGTSPAAAWRTIERVNRHVFSASDRLLFEGGRTFPGSLTLKPSRPDRTDRPAAISSYGTGRATIAAGAGHGLHLVNVADLAVSELIFAGAWDAATQSGSTAAGITVFTDLPGAVKLDGVTITGCEIKGFKAGGIVIDSRPPDSSPSGFRGLTVSRCLIRDNGHVGISSTGPAVAPGSTDYAHANLRIEFTTVHRNLGLRDFGNHSGNGIVLGQVDGGVIEHCVASENGALNTHVTAGPCGIWAWDSRDLVIQFNESHHNSSGPGTADGAGFDLDGGCTGCVLQYNYSHDNRGAGFLLYEFGAVRGPNRGNIVRYNLSENDSAGCDKYAGIYVGDGVADNLIHHNTVFNRTRPPLYVAGGRDTLIADNLLLSGAPETPVAVLAGGTCRLIQNAYWAGGAPLRFQLGDSTLDSLAALHAAGQERHDGVPSGLDADPRLAAAAADVTTAFDRYRPGPGSPLVGAGIDVTRLAPPPPTAPSNPAPAIGAF
jgi:hypothetical protein